jgi:hypothetical protein
MLRRGTEGRPFESGWARHFGILSEKHANFFRWVRALSVASVRL